MAVSNFNKPKSDIVFSTLPGSYTIPLDPGNYTVEYLSNYGTLNVSNSNNTTDVDAGKKKFFSNLSTSVNVSQNSVSSVYERINLNRVPPNGSYNLVISEPVISYYGNSLIYSLSAFSTRSTLLIFSTSDSYRLLDVSGRAEKFKNIGNFLFSFRPFSQDFGNNNTVYDTSFNALQFSSNLLDISYSSVFNEHAALFSTTNSYFLQLSTRNIFPISGNEYLTSFFGKTSYNTLPIIPFLSSSSLSYINFTQAPNSIDLIHKDNYVEYDYTFINPANPANSNSPLSNTGKSVAFTTNRYFYLAGSSTPIIYMSTNLRNWSTSFSTNNSATPHRILFENSTLVFLEGTGTLYNSSGPNYPSNAWNKTSHTVDDMTYFKNNWYAVRAGDPAGMLRFSSDIGTSLFSTTNIGTSGNQGAVGIVSNDSVMVYVERGTNVVRFTTNGTSWNTSITSITFTSLGASRPFIAKKINDPAQTLAIAQETQLLLSTNGFTWTYRIFPNYLLDIAYSPNDNNYIFNFTSAQSQSGLSNYAIIGFSSSGDSVFTANLNYDPRIIRETNSNSDQAKITNAPGSKSLFGFFMSSVNSLPRYFRGYFSTISQGKYLWKHITKSPINNMTQNAIYLSSGYQMLETFSSNYFLSGFGNAAPGRKIPFDFSTAIDIGSNSLVFNDEIYSRTDAENNFFITFNAGTTFTNGLSYLDFLQKESIALGTTFSPGFGSFASSNATAYFNNSIISIFSSKQVFLNFTTLSQENRLIGISKKIDTSPSIIFKKLDS